MNLKEIIKKINLDVKTGDIHLDVDVIRGYCSDLLSDVIANAKEGDLWITLQTHQNIVAVALMKSLSGIVLVNGREPEENTLKKSLEENIPILTTTMLTFELVGKLYEMGIVGS